MLLAMSAEHTVGFMCAVLGIIVGLFVGFLVGFLLGLKTERSSWLARARQDKRLGRTAHFCDGDFWYIIPEKEMVSRDTNVSATNVPTTMPETHQQFTEPRS